MGRECAITGKKTTVGRRIVRKGLSKKKGGIVTRNQCEKTNIQSKSSAS